MVFVGGLVATAIAVAVLVLARSTMPNARERLSAGMLSAAVVLVATGGFYFSEAIGYLVLGGALAAVALLLGFDAGA